MRFCVIIARERCKGCELCVEVCPRQVLGMAKDMNARGAHFALVLKQDQCTGCLQCALICPDAAIEVAREDATDG